MKDPIRDNIFYALHKKLADEDICRTFLEKSRNQKPFIKKFSPSEHFCSFFVPFDTASGSIYLVNHIKANMWIPPGGHIEENETPQETVIREFKEELDHSPTKEEVIFFTLSITKIKDPKKICKYHYDFWYAVFLPVKKFNFLKKEFLDGKWYSLAEAEKIMTRNEFKIIVKNLVNMYYNKK